MSAPTGRSWKYGYVEPQAPRAAGRPRRREQGVALVLVLTVVAVMTVFVADMQETTSTSLQVAVSERDRLKAEYIAKSGLNLTRMLISKERDFRKMLEPLFRSFLKRRPPQINIWSFANDLLLPFSDAEAAQRMGESAGIDLSQMEGLHDTGGTFEVVAVPENSMINVNNALFLGEAQTKKSLAPQFFALMGGFQPESPYDPLFQQPDPDGNLTTREDIVAAIIDWWDTDETRTSYDPATGEITSQGSEDDIYQQFEDPYRVKNAPFDTLEELRMIRGIGDDFWATFIEPEPGDPRARRVTIYASGYININEAPPAVLLAHLCPHAEGQALCADPLEAAKFVRLLEIARSIAPIPWFSTRRDFLNFVEGKGQAGSDLYPMLQSFAPEELLFTPIQLTAQQRKKAGARLLASASIFTIQATGRVERAEVTLETVVNFHDKWTPPPPNAVTMPTLGIFYYYRVR